MLWGLLPVKSPRHAMQRLAPLLSAEQRRTLAKLLYREMLTKLLKSRGFDRIVVVSSDNHTLDAARQVGFMILKETRQRGHSVSVDWAIARMQSKGAQSIITLPIDVPLAKVSEIEQLVSACLSTPAPSVVVIPSENGTGTNGLARTPPRIIDSYFGPDSFVAHSNQARLHGACLKVLRPTGLVFDLDTPDDVRTFLCRSPGGLIYDYLEGIGV